MEDKRMTNLATTTQGRRFRDEMTVSEAEYFVLVAEDDEPLRHSLMDLLAGLGLTAAGIEEGEMLLAWLEPLLLLEDDGCCPDLIITDIMMPGISPLDVVEGLTKVGGDVPVIVVSGVEDTDIHHRVDELGYAFVRKPIIPGELERVVLTSVYQLASRRRREARWDALMTHH